MRRILGVSVLVASLLAGPLSLLAAHPAGAIASPTNHAAGTVTWTEITGNGVQPEGGPFDFHGIWTAGGATYSGVAITNVALLGEGPDPLPVFHLTLLSVPPGGMVGDCTTLFVDPPGAVVLSLLQGVIALVSQLLGLPYQLDYSLQFTCLVHIHGGPAETLSWTTVGLGSFVGDPRFGGVITATGVFAG